MFDIAELESKLRADITSPAPDKNPHFQPYHFRCKPHKGAKLAFYLTDDKVEIRVNPKKVKALDEVYSDCLKVLTW